MIFKKGLLFMNKMELLEKINSSAYLCRDAWDHLYHGKTFVAYNNGCNFLKLDAGLRDTLSVNNKCIITTNIVWKW